MNGAQKYIKDVLDEKIVTNDYIKYACERFNRGLNNQRKSHFPFYFDEKAAKKVLKFYEYLYFWKGDSPNKKFKLEPWQQFYIWDVFGWKREDGDIRKYTNTDLWVARKNGKTTLSAGMGLYGFTKDGETGPKIYIVATKAEQAAICFNDAKEIARCSPSLSSRLKIEEYKIKNPSNSGEFKYLASDSKSMDGLDPYYTIVDEVHAHKTSKTVDVMKSGMGARKQPLMIKTSTAGFRSYAYGYSQFDYSCKVLNGTVENESWHALVYCLDEGDDWKDEQNWLKANPNLGVSKEWSFMRDEFNIALSSLSKEADFKTKQLNVWEQSENGFVSMDKWDKCCTREVKLEEFKEREVLAAFDLGEVSDFSSFGLLGLPRWKDDKYIVKIWRWLPVLSFRDRVNFELLKPWQRQGFIRLTDGFICSTNEMKKDILEIVSQVNLKEPITFDPSRSRQLQGAIHEAGMDTIEMVQTMKYLSPGVHLLEESILSENVEFGKDPVMRWMASNTQVYQASNNAKRFVKKDGQNDDKIDDMIVLSMLFSRANVLEEKPDVYVGDIIII